MGMTWAELANSARLKELPEYYGQRFPGWTPSTEAELAAPYIGAEDLARLPNLCGFPEDLTEALGRACARIDAHREMKLLALYLHWAIFVERPFYLSAWFESLEAGAWGGEAAMLGLCVLCREIPRTLRDLARRKHPNPDDVTGNFKQLVEYARPRREKTGHWGLANAAWCALCVTPWLNTAHHLRFNPAKLDHDFNFYRHRQTGALLGLAGGGIALRGDGLLCDEGEVPALETSFRQTGGQALAHRLSPAGFISLKAEAFDLAPYEKILGQGDILLSFHIPRKPGYTVDNCRASFYAALELFEQAYPEVKPKGFISHSWLYSPQLPLMLEEGDSRIIQLQRQLFLMPAFVDRDAFAIFLYMLDSMPNPEQLPADSRLRALVRDWLMQGRYLSVGCALLPIQDLPRFGGTPYFRQEELDAFKHLSGV